MSVFTMCATHASIRWNKTIVERKTMPDIRASASINIRASTFRGGAG